MNKKLWLNICALCLALTSFAAYGIDAALQSRINNLKNAGKTGVVLQQMVIQRAAGIAPHNRPYVFDGIGDCYGYVRQIWNAILYDGSVHAEDYYPNSYVKSRWIGITGGIPVATAPSSDWALITDRNQLRPGDILSTDQGHAWGKQWHGGIYAGVENGVHKQWDNAGSGGAYKRDFYSGFKYYFRPLHDLLKANAEPAQYPGVFKLVAKHSGKVADVQNGNTADGANIWQWYVNDSNAQRWQISHVADGYYSIKNLISNKFMSVQDAGTANGTNVRQWSWTGTCAQLWRFESVGAGFHKVINKCSGKLLDVQGGPAATGDGTNIQIWDYAPGNDNQLWRIETVPAKYQVLAKHSGKAADVQYGNGANGTNIWQWYVNDSNAQRWDIRHVEDGYFSFKNLQTGKIMGVENAGTANGTNVRQWDWTGTCAQLWKLVSVGDGHLKVANKCSGRVLDVAGGQGATGDGVNIQIYDYVNWTNQMWRLVPVN